MPTVWMALFMAAVPGQVAWYDDLATARAVAKRNGQLLFVAVHKAGERVSDRLWAEVLSNPRFGELLGKDVLPVLVGIVPNGSEALMRSILPDQHVDQVRGLGQAAILDVFGPHADVVTPQQLVLDSDGAVLWQGLRERSLSELRRALAAARSDAKRAPQLRGTDLRAKAARLGRLAARDEEAFEQLAVLARHACPEHFALILEAVAASGGIAGRLVDHVCCGLGPARAAALASAVQTRRACSKFAARIVPDASEAARVASSPRARDELVVSGPLPVVRSVEDVSSIRFTDGRTRTLSGLRGRPTVLMFLLRTANDFAVQLATLKPEIEDLRDRGVECLALFAAIDVDAELTAVRGLELPCPVGVYAYDSLHPFQGIGFFPTALVLDDNARAVYADDPAPGMRAYAGFAPTARGLARASSPQPLLGRETAAAK